SVMAWPDCLCDHTFLEMLSSGLPSEVDLQVFIQDTEEKLRLNACSIEQNLQDLQRKIGGVLGGEKVLSPEECLQRFSPGNLGSLHPVSTSRHELRDFLRALLHLLKAQEACEEAVLHLLLSVSSQCGVAFPCSRPLSEQGRAPAPTLCSVRDDLALEVQDTWDDIRRLLQRHLLGKLQTAAAVAPAESSEGPVAVRGAPEKSHVLQKLVFLLPKKEVLAKYQALQSKVVRGLIRGNAACALGRGSGHDRRGFDGLAQHFQAVSPTFRAMLAEEVRVLNRLAEPREIVAFLNGAYLGPAMQELVSFMETEVELAQNNAALSEKGLKSASKTSAVGGFRLHSLLAIDGCCSALWQCDKITLASRGKNGAAIGASSPLILLPSIRSQRPQRTQGSLRAEDSDSAPPESPGKGRHVLLTSRQLRGLTQLAATLLEMEQSVEDLATVLGSLHHPGEDDCSVGAKDLLQNIGADIESTVLDGRTSPPERLFPKTETVRLEFDWRAAFHQLTPQMSRSVELVLEEVCRDALQQEESTHASRSKPLPLVHTPLGQDSHPPGLERDVPKRIAKATPSERSPSPPAVQFCADVTEQTDALLPLAVACQDPALLPVRSCYVEACGRATSALLARLEERAAEVPASAPLRNLAALLASSAHVHQRVAHYESHLKGAGRTSLTLLPVKRSQEVVEALHEHLTGYCINVCATSLLQDAESHHWADPGPFHEGERCSFSIQMWHYFLCGLRSDLWETLAPLLAQDILAQVLAQTLELLLQRYSRARPSYRRLPQIRADITAILLCVHQLMWSVCGSVEELVRPVPASGTWVAFIHGLCDQLLDVLVILTAPLPELYRSFRNGFSERPPSTSMEAGATCVPFWLTVINPELFPQELRVPVAGCRSSLWLLGLLCSGPSRRWPLLLRTTLHADCLLPRTLISHSHLCLDGEVEVSPEAQQAADEFVEAVFAILSSLNSVPRALALVLEDYLDRTHQWERFHSLAVEEEPSLFRCIRAVVSKPTSCLLSHLVNMTQECEDLPAPLLRPDLLQDVLAKIPSKWKYTPQETEGKEAGKNSIALPIQALFFIYTHLPSAVTSLPLPVRYLFHVAEKRLLKLGQQPKAAGLLPWVLLDCLSRDLEDGRSLKQASHLPLGRGAKELLALVAECLRVSMGQQRGETKPTVQKVLQTLEEKRPKWSATQLQKACGLCADSMFEQAEGGLLEEKGGPSEPTEQKMGPALLALCQGTGGSQHLGRIHRTIQLNEGLLRSILTSAEDGAPPLLGPPSVLFPSCGASSSPPCLFDPLSHFHRLAPARFHQVSAAFPQGHRSRAGKSNVNEKERDCAQLLTSYQRMSQVTFTVLLANSSNQELLSADSVQDKIWVKAKDIVSTARCRKYITVRWKPAGNKSRHATRSVSEASGCLQLGRVRHNSGGWQSEAARSRLPLAGGVVELGKVQAFCWNALPSWGAGCRPERFLTFRDFPTGSSSAEVELSGVRRTLCRAGAHWWQRTQQTVNVGELRLGTLLIGTWRGGSRVEVGRGAPAAVLGQIQTLLSYAWDATPHVVGASMLFGADVFVFCFAWLTMAQLLAQEDKEKTTALKDLLSRIDLDELMKKDEPPLVFPKTLEEFEYAFNEHGQLRHTKTGEPFVFNHKEDLHRWNQKRYEALGEIITQHVYERLEQDCGLRRQTLPVDATEDEPKTFMYMSEDALSNPSRLLILIQGSGVVRAGQWARRLIINNDLDSGTQIPFITRAIEGSQSPEPLNPVFGKSGSQHGGVITASQASKGLPQEASDPKYQWMKLRVEEAPRVVPSAGISGRMLLIRCCLAGSFPRRQCGLQEGYGVVVLNPNDNFLEVEKAEEPGGGEAAPDGSDEPAEKRERKEERESKRRTDFYEKYRNPQKEKETDRIPIRVNLKRIQSAVRAMSRAPVLWAPPSERLTPALLAHGNSSPEEHTLYVWDHFISTSLAKNIFVVAHSYGGLSFLDLVSVHIKENLALSYKTPLQPSLGPRGRGSLMVEEPTASEILVGERERGGGHKEEAWPSAVLTGFDMIQREEEVKSRVCAVAMTDSVHNVWHQNANRSIQGWLKERCCNWVSSPEPLDTPVEPMLPDCLHLSAGLGYGAEALLWSHVLQGTPRRQDARNIRRSALPHVPWAWWGLSRGLAALPPSAHVGASERNPRVHLQLHSAHLGNQELAWCCNKSPLVKRARELSSEAMSSVRADPPQGSLQGPGSFAYLLGDALLLTLELGPVREALTAPEFTAGSRFFSKHMEQDESVEQDEEKEPDDREVSTATPVSMRSSNRARHEDL
ncbi:hypothetical protein P4O66_012136, partial [Electrophorus voltai]